MGSFFVASYCRYYSVIWWMVPSIASLMGLMVFPEVAPVNTRFCPPVMTDLNWIVVVPGVVVPLPSTSSYILTAAMSSACVDAPASNTVACY